MIIVCRWRKARFGTREQRTEFIDHSRTIDAEGLEVEPFGCETDVRFRAPASLELAIAEMIDAHGGKMMPTP